MQYNEPQAFVVFALLTQIWINIYIVKYAGRKGHIGDNYEIELNIWEYPWKDYTNIYKSHEFVHMYM